MHKADGGLLRGQHVSFDAEGLALRIERPSKVKGRSAKLEEETTAIPFADIRTTQATTGTN